MGHNGLISSVSAIENIGTGNDVVDSNTVSLFLSWTPNVRIGETFSPSTSGLASENEDCCLPHGGLCVRNVA